MMTRSLRGQPLLIRVVLFLVILTLFVIESML